MSAANDSPAEYSAEQKAILRWHSVSHPQCLPSPEAKLEFANAAEPTSADDPMKLQRLHLDARLLLLSGLAPVQRMHLHEMVEAASRGRFERSVDAPRTLGDDEYVAAIEDVLPYLESESAITAKRIVAYLSAPMN